MMSTVNKSADFLLARAQQGSGESLGQLLQLYTNYLRILVVSQLDGKLRQRVSPSDVVQETFFEAHRDFQQFRGKTTPEFLAWLRKILVNNLHTVVEKHVLAGKRDVRREVSAEKLGADLEKSTLRLDAFLPDPGESPSMHLQQREMQVRLANELAALPEDYRDAIVMRHLEGLPFEEIGRRMDRTAGAVRMLWLRAIKLLRERMATDDDSSGVNT
ncbi:sigma-70 family RNA polymerase sigma factor [Adhaeretor mobilis]|uniref:ECF RNA polymerase sigma-E factor n=1 Tax=Adhaeretor mobilis TaxID=1930276 RepID=A0A517MXK8_9BACT|nr:sigma-70 family RNA polymerase sigma factor [Adhaeretor mobilis]QDS99615.1 ECF RNA polymerase sigma-E factor [Adhaeretor mobilis]